MSCPVDGSGVPSGSSSAPDLSWCRELDLTDHCRPRAKHASAQLMALNRLVHRLIPSAASRQVMDSHLGGLALERLTPRGSGPLPPAHRAKA